jgi:hypothetical protein
MASRALEERTLVRRPSVPRPPPAAGGAPQAGEVGVVAEAAGCVLERELAHLAIDPGPVDRDRLALDRRAATTDSIVSWSSAMPATWESTGDTQVSSPRRALRPQTSHGSGWCLRRRPSANVPSFRSPPTADARDQAAEEVDPALNCRTQLPSDGNVEDDERHGWTTQGLRCRVPPSGDRRASHS